MKTSFKFLAISSTACLCCVWPFVATLILIIFIALKAEGK
jgi:hypothetical protein